MTAEIFGHDYVKKIPLLIFDFYCTHSHIPEVNETSELRWVERDTIDQTGTHQQWSPALTTHFARQAVILGNLSDVDFGLPTSPRASFQSAHLAENTCHEKSDFYIIIMIVVYVL